MSTLFGGRECVDPVVHRRACLDARPEPLPIDWWGKANVFRNPQGRGPGAGAILLTKADYDALDRTADHVLSFDDDRTAEPPVELKRITLLHAECLSPGFRGDPRAVYLCHVVDRRHFLAQIPVDRAFNVRDADGTGYLSATLKGGTTPWTWDEVIKELWAALDDSGSLGGIPARPSPDPDGLPENLRFHAGGGWEALNAVLDRLGWAVRLDHTTDTFAFVRLGDTAAAGATALASALARYDRDGLRTWDAYHLEPDRGRLPESVRVLFPRRPVPTDGGSPFYAVDVALAATAGVEAGTFVQLQDDLTAVGEGIPSNLAALTTRANERAGDWRRKRLGYERRLTLVYRDFRPDLTPGETVEQAALDDHGGPLATVLESGPDGRLEAFRPWVPPLGSDIVAPAGACRAALASLDPARDRVLFRIIPAATTARCAEIEAATLVGYAPDPDVYEWVSIGGFPTKLGNTTITYRYDPDTGEPVMLLTGVRDDGSAGTTTVIQPMTRVTCVGGCEEYVARPLLWCDSDPVTDCDDCPAGAPRRWRFTLENGTGDFEDGNGEWTVVRTTGCTWSATRGEFTATVFTLGPLSVLRVANADESVSVQWVASLTCCADWTPDIDDISSETGSPPDRPTVTPLGPCVSARCVADGFKVRVCCKGHTKYNGCDASPLPADTSLWPTCLVTRNSSGTVTSSVDIGPPVVNTSAPLTAEIGLSGIFGFECHSVDHCITGWYIPLFNGTGQTLFLWYEPGAAGGEGAWVYALASSLVVGGDSGFFCAPTLCVEESASDTCTNDDGSLSDYFLAGLHVAANDPSATDDDFKIQFVFAGGVTITAELGPCPTVPPPPPPPPPPAAYECVEGVCVEQEGGSYDEPTCGGDCASPPPPPPPPPGPPVCDAPACPPPGGATESYTYTLSGGTDDFAGANGTWTVTHTTGNTWVGVLGSWTATLTASTGGPTLILHGPCGALITYVTGSPFNCCGPTTFTASGSNTGCSGLGAVPDLPTVSPVGDCSGCP